MAKLSLTDQLTQAAAEGNLDKVKEIAEKLKEQAAKVKPKAKPKKKSAPVKKPKPVKVETEEVIDTATLDPDYMVPAKSGRRQNSKYDDDDDRTLATREPFRAVKRKNTFKDNMTDNVGDINFDKSWYEKTGDSSVKREKVKKIKVICSRCKEAKVTLSNDFIHASWTCDDCLGNIRGR